MSASKDYSPEVVAQSFIKQYYEVLANTPQELHRFYKEQSSFTYGEGPQISDVICGTELIKEQVRKLDFLGARVDLSEGSIDAQRSESNGVFLVVTGELTMPGKPTRTFLQTFFLAEQILTIQSSQTKSYYVYNSVLRVLEGLKTPETHFVATEESAVENRARVESFEVISEAEVVEANHHLEELRLAEESVAAASEVSTAHVSEEKIAEPIESLSSSELAGPPTIRSYRDMILAKNAGTTAIPAVPRTLPPSGRREPVPAPVASTELQPVVPTQKIIFSVYVKDIPEDTAVTELKQLFGRFGGVVHVDPYNAKRFAFIELDSEATLAAVLNHSEPITLRGVALKVEERTSTKSASGDRGGRRSSRGRGGSGGGGGGGSKSTDEKSARGGVVRGREGKEVPATTRPADGDRINSRGGSRVDSEKGTNRSNDKSRK